jgi:hypothetical protein
MGRTVSSPTHTIMSNLKDIILYLCFAVTIIGVFGSLFYGISTWQRQSLQNQQNMVNQAKQACDGRLLFYFQEYSTGHPIFACEQK